MVPIGRPLQLAALALVASLCAASLVACDPEPLYSSCRFSHSIEAACLAEAETTIYSCVVAPKEATEENPATNGHPSCLEKICASYLGSDPFCTRACEDDSACPSDSACRTQVMVMAPAAQAGRAAASASARAANVAARKTGTRRIIRQTLPPLRGDLPA